MRLNALKLKIVKETLRSILTSPFTIKHPFEPSYPPEHYRGKPEIDWEKCIGCGACVEGCPPKAITMIKDCDYLSLEVFYGKCIFCGRCSEVCPEDAIKMTKTYSLVTTKREDIVSRGELTIILCIRCGKPIISVRGGNELEKKLKPLELPLGYVEFSKLCADCRKVLQARALLGERIKRTSPTTI